MKTHLHSYFSKGLIATCLFICSLISVNTFADIPRTLSIQGYVKNIEQDTALQGEHDVRFTLYDTSGRSTQYMNTGGDFIDATGSGASVVWTSVLLINFDEGKYSVQLGSENPFPIDAFINETEMLGITISNDDELSPRMALNSVPYSIRSSTSSNVDGDITPKTVSIFDDSGAPMLVIDENGKWHGQSTGLVGATGETGLQGEQGIAGADGAKGDTGANGAAGIQGLKGDTGANGAAGIQGPQGDQGLKGDTGANGAAGIQGPQGDQGLKGDTGADGFSGSNGSPGLVGSSVITTKQCTTGTNCACPVNTLLISGGAACSKNQYLYKSQPVLNSKTTWQATCEVFSTGADADPASINLICASDNDA
jgi:hypothetical protein